MRKRYCITNLNKHGLRVLTLTNQGRFHFDDALEAKKVMDELEPGLREKILGDRADTLEIREVDCYDHGDATRTVFDE